MEKQRIKLEVYQGLPIIQEMIKDLAITKEMGENACWLDRRQNKRMSRNFQFTFTESDVAKLNAAIWRIGERLSVTKIEYNVERQQVINQIKEKLSDVFLPYIYLDKMGVKKYWWNYRMANDYTKGQKCTFKQEDIVKINLAVAEIAARLLAIELIVE